MSSEENCKASIEWYYYLFAGIGFVAYPISHIIYRKYFSKKTQVQEFNAKKTDDIIQPDGTRTKTTFSVSFFSSLKYSRKGEETDITGQEKNTSNSNPNSNTINSESILDGASVISPSISNKAAVASITLSSSSHTEQDHTILIDTTHDHVIGKTAIEPIIESPSIV